MNNFEEKKEALERIVKDLVSVTNIYPLTRVIYDMKNYAEKRNRINSGKDIPDDLAFQKEILEKLNEKERMIVNKRFFEARTQMEVAEEIGISQAQVSRLEKSAIEHIKRLYK